MRIIKPITLPVMHRAFGWRGKNYLCLLTFTPVKFTAPSVMIGEQNMYAALGEVIPGKLLDEVMPKRRHEIFIYANAYPPSSAEDCSEVIASAKVLSKQNDLPLWTKSLRAYGERSWVRQDDGTYLLTKPKPFDEIPLGWTSAFGGKEVKKNLLGKGHLSAAEGQVDLFPAHQVEYENLHILSPGQHVQRIGCFDSHAPDDPTRFSLMGTYDLKWVENECPALAKDLDWSYYNRAPEDQHVDDLGDASRMVFQNMNKKYPMLEFIPHDFRCRSFVKFAAQNHLQEIKQVADTLFLFPSIEMAIFAHRGIIPVGRPDALDVEGVMFAYEHEHDAPRSEAHYVQEYEKRTDPEKSVRYLLDERPLRPIASDQEVSLLQEAKLEAENRFRNSQDMTAELMLERMAEEDDDGMGLMELEAAQGASPPAGPGDDLLANVTGKVDELGMPPMITEYELKNFCADFQGLFDWMNEAQKMAESLKEMAEGAEGAFEQAYASVMDQFSSYEQELGIPEELREPPASIDLDLPDPVSSDKLYFADKAFGRKYGSQLDHLFEVDLLENSKKIDEYLDQGADQLAQGKPSLENMPPLNLPDQLPTKTKKFIEKKIDQSLREEPTFDRAKADEALSNLDVHQEEIETAARESVMQFHQARLMAPMLIQLDPLPDHACAEYLGDVLAMFCASDADLSYRDFSGASVRAGRLAKGNFSNVIINKFDAEKARIDDCRFDHAVLVGSNFQNAKLHGCTFNDANLSETNFQGAILHKLQFSENDFSKTIWSGATFWGCTFNNVSLQNCSLDHVSFQHCTFKDCDFYACNLDHTSWDLSNLEACDFMDCSMSHAQMTNMKLKKTGMQNAPAIDLILKQVVMEQTTFRDSDLSSGIFEHVTLKGPGNSFGNCLMDKVQVSDSCLDDGDFSMSTLSNSVMTRTSFKRCLMTEANLSRADFRGCDLLDTNAHNADMSFTDFRDSNMFRMTLTNAVFAHTLVEQAYLYGTILDKTHYGRK